MRMRGANAPSTCEPSDARNGQMLGRPARHQRHAPQVEKNVSDVTRAPAHAPSTPRPSSATTPQSSWPIVTGGTHGYSPASMCRSVPQIPAASSSITTSPGPATASGRSAYATWPAPAASFATPFMRRSSV